MVEPKMYYKRYRALPEITEFEYFGKIICNTGEGKHPVETDTQWMRQN